MIDYKSVYKDIAPKEQIVSGAVAYVRGRVGVAGALSLEMLMEGALEVVKSIAVEKIYPDVLRLLDNSVAMFQMTEGERPIGDHTADEQAASAGEITEHAEWRDKFDTYLLSQLGTDMQRDIGVGAIGEHFTDADIDDEATRGKVAREIAERLAESAMVLKADPTQGVSIEKTLSAAGVVKADFDGTVSATGAALVAERAISPVEARSHVEQIAGNYAIRLGADGFDLLVLDEILTTAFDDDEFIAIGGVERLGASHTERPYFSALAKAMPGECKGNTLNAAYTAVLTGEVIAPAVVAKPKKIKVAKAAAVSPAAAPPSVVPSPSATGGASLPSTPNPDVSAGDYSDIVRIWRSQARDSDQDLATHFDVSRGTISNIGLGKSKLSLTPEQKAKTAVLLRAKAEQFNLAAQLLE